MDQDMEEQERLRELFGFGRAGEQVPKVDPSDMKALWDLGQDTKKTLPEGGVAIGVEVMRALCKPGANVTATSYRANMIVMLQHAAPEIMAPFDPRQVERGVSCRLGNSDGVDWRRRAARFAVRC